MGGSEIDVSQIPLMSPAQEESLAQLLPAIMGMMSGYPLGQAYGGPSESSYGVTSFPEFNLKAIEDARGEHEGDKITKEGLTNPNNPGGLIPGKGGDGTTTPGGTVGGGVGGPLGKPLGVQPKAAIPSQALEPVLDVILGSQPQTNIPNVQTPESQPISPIQQALTQPIISPFTQGMTGNFPRRPGRRGGG